jgi:hypothetical protein
MTFLLQFSFAKVYNITFKVILRDITSCGGLSFIPYYTIPHSGQAYALNTEGLGNPITVKAKKYEVHLQSFQEILIDVNA